MSGVSVLFCFPHSRYLWNCIRSVLTQRTRPIYILTNRWMNTEALPNAKMTCCWLFLSILSKIQLFKNTQTHNFFPVIIVQTQTVQQRNETIFWTIRQEKWLQFFNLPLCLTCLKTLLEGKGGMWKVLWLSIILITFKLVCMFLTVCWRNLCWRPNRIWSLR